MTTKIIPLRRKTRGVAGVVPGDKPSLDLGFELERDVSSGQVTGFIVLAGRGEGAKQFCRTFSKAFATNRAKVTIVSQHNPPNALWNGIAIENTACASHSAQVFFQMSDDDFRGLLEILALGYYFSSEPLDGGAGFRVRISWLPKSA